MFVEFLSRLESGINSLGTSGNYSKDPAESILWCSYDTVFDAKKITCMATALDISSLANLACDKTSPALVRPKISGAHHILVEARILTALRSGNRKKLEEHMRRGRSRKDLLGTTRRDIYRKLGGGMRVNRHELERILDEMVARGLIERFREYPNWQYWRYRINQPQLENHELVIAPNSQEAR